MKYFLVLFGGLSIGFLAALFYIFLSPINSQGYVRFIDAPQGKTFFQVAEELENKKLIRSSLAFKILVKLYGEPVLQKGEYQLSQQESLWRQFQKLKQAQVHYTLITLPEGVNHYEIGELLKNYNADLALAFLHAFKDKTLIQKLLKEDLNSFEGYLYPETYSLHKYMTIQELLTSMVTYFLKAYNRVQTPSFLTRHQAVTLASLVEKETGVPEERSLIASVFYNRIKKGMRLQTDPTILYSLYLKRGFSIEKNIRKKDILHPSPYNTYVVQGLPPGPIASPGQESLRAVFKPAQTDYLFFVSKGDGTHEFSKTYKEHKKFVEEYQIKPFQKRQKEKQKNKIK